MPTSQNGWAVFTSPPVGELDEWITGRVRPGDVAEVFDYLCDRIDADVEAIRKDWSWGWAYRAIRGQTTGFSNHASGTAIDINAPAHPLGVTGTWSSSEKDRVHVILRDLRGVVRWGEDYSGRKDGMHFEINAGTAEVAAVADLIREGRLPGLVPEWKPKQANAVHFGRTQEQFLIALGVSKGNLKQHNGIGRVQQALNQVLRPSPDLKVDGYVGKATLNAWGRWETLVGGRGRPRVPDGHSIAQLSDRAGFDVVGKGD